MVIVFGYTSAKENGLPKDSPALQQIGEEQMLIQPSVGRYTRLRKNPSFDLLAGWRYLISREYRKTTHSRWQNENAALVGLEIMGGVIGMGLSGGFAWFVISALRFLATSG